MEFRAGSPADAEAIAGLIASFQSELTDDPSGAGAEEYLASVSLQAEREYLASERYRYLVAYSDSQLAGFIAIRDGTHLFHLFVERSHQRVYEVRPRKDKRGFDLISDALPFGRLWYDEANAVSNVINYAKFFSRSHDAVIRVCDEAGNVIETHEHKGEFKEA